MRTVYSSAKVARFFQQYRDPYTNLTKYLLRRERDVEVFLKGHNWLWYDKFLLH